MLCSLQKRLTVSISHRDAPSSSGPSAAGEEQRDSLILLCEAGDWLGACGTGPAPAAPGRTKCRVPGDRPATPARADTQPPPLPIQCHRHGEALAPLWGNRKGREAGAVGCRQGARLLPSCCALDSPRSRGTPLLPPAEQPRSASCTAAAGTGRAEAERTSPAGLPQCTRAG